MKLFSRNLSLTLIIGVVILASFAEAKDLVIKPPPESLSKYYPPASKKTEWIQQMHKLSTHFGGVFVNLKEKDFENVDKHADKLAEAYKKASEMVPVWEDYFDMKALDKFVSAAKTHDIAQAGKASGDLGKTCGKCHGDNYISVWTKFHWPSFHKIKVTDPSDDKEMPFDDYMGKLSSSFKGVTVNFAEGQYDRSKKALRKFKARFMELRSTCSKCHTTDDVKLFYVGKRAERIFDNLKAEISKGEPNPAMFWKNIGALGKMGCKNCHLTHRAYSIIKERWEEK